MVTDRNQSLTAEPAFHCEPPEGGELVVTAKVHGSNRLGELPQRVPFCMVVTCLLRIVGNERLAEDVEDTPAGNKADRGVAVRQRDRGESVLPKVGFNFFKQGAGATEIGVVGAFAFFGVEVEAGK